MDGLTPCVNTRTCARAYREFPQQRLFRPMCPAPRGATCLERFTSACAVGAMRGDLRIGYAVLMRNAALDAGIVSALLLRYCP
jgi:hypothetical protein